MSFFCSCCAPNESNDGQLTEKNRPAAVGLNDMSILEEHPSTQPAVHEPIQSTPTGAAHANVDGLEDSPRSPSKSNLDKSNGSRAHLSAEEKEAEKQRLQKLVKEFAKEAVKGIPMTVMTSDGSKGSIIFQMENYLRYFTLEEKAGETEPGFLGDDLRKVDMKQIESVYRGGKILKRNPTFTDPDYATEYIECEIVPTGLETRPTKQTIFFHIPDDYARDKFYTCLKILRLSVEVKG